MSEDFLMTEWKDNNSKLDGDREAGDGTDVVLGLQQTSSPVILKPPLPSTVQQPYQNRRKNIGGQDLQGVSPNGDVAFNSNNETSKLLDISSSSSSESDLNLQIIPPKRKVRFKRKLRPLQKGAKSKSSGACRDDSVGGSSCCCCTGGEGLGGLALVLVFCALGTLMWFHYGLSSRLDSLQKQVKNMETQNKETPETLHDYHIQLKGLESNVTAFGQSLKQINKDLAMLNDTVKEWKKIANSLQDSIAAAPEIKNLPRDVVSITESVATFGSKISVLESNIEDLKKTQRQLTDSERELKTENQQIKGSLAGLSVQRDTSTREDAQAMQNRLTEYLRSELTHLTSSVDELNVTTSARLRDVDQRLSETNESLTWVSNDLSQLHVFVYQNLSSTGSYMGGKGLDPALLGPALQQEAQHILRDILVNGSQPASANLSSAVGSQWKEAIAHAQQVSLAYWALLKDLSLSPSDVQDPSVVLEALLNRTLSNFTANTTIALQGFNESLEILSLRTERLEAWHQGSQPLAATTTMETTTTTTTTTTTPAEPPVAGEDVPLEKKPAEKSEVEGEQAPPSTSASTSREGQGTAVPTAMPTSAPTVPNAPKILQSKMPTSMPLSKDQESFRKYFLRRRHNPTELPLNTSKFPTRPS